MPVLFCIPARLLSVCGEGYAKILIFYVIDIILLENMESANWFYFEIGP